MIALQVTCNVSRKRFNHKPTNPETGKLQNELIHPVQIEIAELAETLCTGGNMRIVACKDGSGDEAFSSGQLIGLDCDNAVKDNIADVIYHPEDVRRILAEHNIIPNFQYYTWSHTDTLPKFRTIITLDKPITDYGVYMGIMQYVASLFDEYHADRRARTVSRIFYGSGCGKPCYADYDAVNSTDALMEMAAEQIAQCRNEQSTASPKKQRTGKSRKCNSADTANLRVIRAIREHDVDYLKRRIRNKRTTLDCKKDLYDFIYRIPLDDFLEVDKGKAFRCILPDHEDKNPSASVFQTHYGTWKYKCHADCLGNGTTLNIKQLIECLGNFRSEYKAIKFICDIFNLKVKETQWSVEQAANIDRIINCITSADAEDGFSSICPVASKVTRNAIFIYLQILNQAKQTLYPEKSGSGDIIFYLSIRKLAAVSGKGSLSQVQNYVKQLCYCHMLEVLTDQQVPQAMLKKAIEARADGQKRTGFYSIPSWVQQRVAMIEDSGKRWRENRYTLKGVSFEMFYRSEPAEAARLYPESKTRILDNGVTVTRTTTKAADERQEAIADFVLSEIKQHGYCTEAKIINAANIHTMARTQIARSMTDICNCYNLKKIRCNKALKELYNVPGHGYPVIIIEG